jgi:hypothetical protein
MTYHTPLSLLTIESSLRILTQPEWNSSPRKIKKNGWLLESGTSTSWKASDGSWVEAVVVPRGTAQR